MHQQVRCIRSHARTQPAGATSNTDSSSRTAGGRSRRWQPWKATHSTPAFDLHLASLAALTRPRYR